MPTQTSDCAKPAPRPAVLELATGDPLAALRHVAACLARRSHPLLGLSLSPVGAGEGKLVVAVADDGRLERLVAELRALPEILAARLGHRGDVALTGLSGHVVA
ncbi:MAG: hypothetical protein ACLGQH_09205 [Acidobacteriota bacterium]